MRAFVIAMESEAKAVYPTLREGDRFYISGVGKVNAAMATQKAIDEGATEIVNAGVCGGFLPTMEVGDVFEVERAVQYDFDLSDLNSTPVGQLDERTSPYFELSFASRPEGTVVQTLATGDHFRNNDDDLPLLRSLGVTLRDMEGAAIAQVCEKNKVPCRLIKSVTNVQGKGSMTGQYADNLATALKTLQDYLLKKIRILLILAMGAVLAFPDSGFAADAEARQNTTLAPVPKLEQDNYDWYARHERILSEAKAMNPEIVLIGDSITHHWAGINSIGGEDATPHFKAAFKGKRVLDLGFGWDRIQNMLWRVNEGELGGLRPKTIIIMAGTNNMTGTKNARANDAKEIAEGVINLVKSVKKKCPKAKIVVMGILPRAGKNDPMRATAKEANGILDKRIGKLAKREVLDFIDLSEKFVDETGERIKALYRDQVHLSPAGYAIWAEAIKAYL